MKPVVLIFSQTTEANLTSLVKKIDAEISAKKIPNLTSIVVFLGDGVKQSEGEDFIKSAATEKIPYAFLKSMKDAAAYNLHADAKQTIILYNKKKVVANFAFKEKELTEDKINLIISNLDQLK